MGIGHGWNLTRALSQTLGGSDSHDDFKPQIKEMSEEGDVFGTIKNDISNNRIFVYMKVTLRILLKAQGRLGDA